MSWRCDLTGKGPLVGHKVSHSNIKTKRRFLPNLRNVTLISDTLGRRVRLRVSANALKTVDHRGGLDAFLLKAKDEELAPRMLELKRQIARSARPRQADLSYPSPDRQCSASCRACTFLGYRHFIMALTFTAPPPKIAEADCAGEQRNCRRIQR